MAKEFPEGCVYLRGKRWWYKLRGKFYPCTPPGRHYATTRRAVAGELARLIYDRQVDADGDMGQLVGLFEDSERTRSGMRHHRQKIMMVKRFLRWCGIEAPQQITPAKIEDYLAKRASQGRATARLSNKTLLNERANIGRFCQWLLLRGEIDSNPIQRTSPPKLLRKDPIYLTRSELGAALWAAKRLEMWPVFFAAYTGMRLGELTRLRWGDIRSTPRGPVLVVRESKQNRPHSVPVSSKLVRVIRRLGKPGPPDEFIFGQMPIHKWSRALAAVKAAVPKLGRPGGGWRDFRRTVGSLLVQGGTPIFTVARILGHANISTTARYYAHLEAEAGRADLEHL